MEGRASRPLLPHTRPRRYTGGAPWPPNGSVATEPALEFRSRMGPTSSLRREDPVSTPHQPERPAESDSELPFLGQVLPYPGHALGQQARDMHLADTDADGDLRLGQAIDEPEPHHLLLTFGQGSQGRR